MVGYCCGHIKMRVHTATGNMENESRHGKVTECELSIKGHGILPISPLDFTIVMPSLPALILV